MSPPLSGADGKDQDVVKRYSSESRTLLEMAIERGLVEPAAAARAAAAIGTEGVGERLVQLGVCDTRRLAELRTAFQQELHTRSSFAPDAMQHPTPPAAPAPAARRIGHYRLLEELGRGAMGVVHRAFDERSAVEVALKLLPQEVAEDAYRRRRLLEEARKAAMLKDCRHVVAVIEAGVVDDRAFLAMELVDGQTLEAWLARPHQAQATSALLLQLIDGVAAAHAVGLVHRDIKPSNLMVTPAGELKILDFGLAKDVVGPPSPESIDSVVGTPVYMAPELLQMALGLVPNDGSAAHSARVDVYSIGVTACEAFAGHRPFPPMHSYGALLEQKLAVRALVRGALGKRPVWPWGRVVPQMLAPDPAARPADGLALQRLVRGAGDAPAPGRNRQVAAAVAVVALGLGIAAATMRLAVGPAVGAAGALLGLAAFLSWPRRPRRRPARSDQPDGQALPAGGPLRESVRGAPAQREAETVLSRVPLPTPDPFETSLVSVPMQPLRAPEFHEEYWIGPFCLKVCIGDLTRLGAEGWVSTDDSRLTMSGGVSATIAMRLGSAFRRVAASHVPVPVGRVVVTPVDMAPVRCVLHAITMGFDTGGRAVPPTLATMASCVDEVFRSARRLGLRSLAIPSLGTGAGGLPPVEVAKLICGRAIEQLADRTNTVLQTIVFVTGSADDPLLAAIRNRVLEAGPREMAVRRGAARVPTSGLVAVD